MKFNWKNLVKDCVRFGIAWLIFHFGLPVTALLFLSFFDVTFEND